MLPMIAEAQQPASPTKPSEKATPPPQPPEGPYGPGTVAGPNVGSAFGNVPTPPRQAPSAGAPLVYSTSRSDVALRIEDLMRGAAALRTQNNFAKAMALYDEVLTIAPRYAEGYRQRAITLARLGNRVQAQIDYDHFLELDPKAADQVREEVTLFEQSGQARIGEAEAASYSYGLPIANGQTATPVTSLAAPPESQPPIVGAINVPPIRTPQELASLRFQWAQDAFQRRDYENALDWAERSNFHMPQARTRALLAQIRFAQGDFKGAAAEARAAAAMGPVMDWRGLFGYYGDTQPRFTRQMHALEQYIRQNPSSADAHFLLGYQYLILGQTDPAHAQLAIAAVLEPTDVVATNLLAKDGVEIVGSRRGLAQVAPAREGVEVARRPGVAPPAPSPAPSTRPEVTR
ncbi:MAG: tetratricopeptide repeat protein [Thermoguttaceae bacterium]